MVSPVDPAPRDLPDRPAVTASPAVTAMMVCPDLPAPLVSVVSARNIALWMVAFSSKMVESRKPKHLQKLTDLARFVKIFLLLNLAVTFDKLPASRYFV
jgi:hypothetical protein